MVDSDASVVAAADRACAVRHAGSPALTLVERLFFEGMVRTAVSRMSPSMSHSDDHERHYSMLLKKRQLALAMP